MANQGNLRSWPKGTSGNPNGHSRDRRELARLDAGGDFDAWFDLFKRITNRSIDKRLKAIFRSQF